MLELVLVGEEYEIAFPAELVLSVSGDVDTVESELDTLVGYLTRIGVDA